MIEFNQDLALQLLESEVEFPVDFEDAWKWLEYSRKDHAKTSFMKCGFIENIDYIIRPPEVAGDVATQGFQPPNKELIFLTTDAFKQWSMIAGTDKGKEVRLYFIKCEKLLKEQIKKNQLITQSELALQLSSFIEEQRQTTKLLMERTNKLDAIEQGLNNNQGLKDILDGELINQYTDDIKFNVTEYLNYKRVDLSYATTLRKRAAQFVRCGTFGEPVKTAKGLMYTGNQVNYLDCALRTILDI